jgi:hypothetical protein
MTSSVHQKWISHAFSIAFLIIGGFTGSSFLERSKLSSFVLSSLAIL